MMRHFNLSYAAALGFAAMLAFVTGAGAGGPAAIAWHAPSRALILEVVEELGSPPANKSGGEILTPAIVQDAVNAQLKADFDAAADPKTRLLTPSAAKAAGWGFIFDHFSQIDRDKDGSVSLKDITAYLMERNATNAVEPEPKKLQIVQ
jgi:hypothetical protein